MNRHIALTSVLVHDYDAAIDFFVDKLRFTLIEDTELPAEQSSTPTVTKRWVVVSPGRHDGRVSSAGLLLAKAEGEEQMAAVGHQSGGRVFLFLETDDFWRDYNHMKSVGVEFVRGEPRQEEYGTVAVFRDISGNLWDLIERAG